MKAFLELLKQFLSKYNIYNFFPDDLPTPLKVKYPTTLMPTNAERLVEITKEYVGNEASPLDLAPDDLSCAEGVSNIIHELFPDFPSGVVSTFSLFNILRGSKHFEVVLTPEVGCVIVSPRIGKQPGHTGIFITDKDIVSNSSKTGKMEKNYTYESWIKYFKGRNLHVYLFKTL